MEKFGDNVMKMKSLRPDLIKKLIEKFGDDMTKLKSLRHMRVKDHTL